MDKRGSIAARRSPGAFRCLPCKRVVIGTESGHCPNCGFVPPVSLSSPSVPAPARPVSIVLVTLVIAVLVAVLVFVTN